MRDFNQTEVIRAPKQGPTSGRQLFSAAKLGFYSDWPAIMWSLFDDVMKDPIGAKIYGRKRTVKLSDVWETKAAHTPAHPVSNKAV